MTSDNSLSVPVHISLLYTSLHPFHPRLSSLHSRWTTAAEREAATRTEEGQVDGGRLGRTLDDHLGDEAQRALGADEKLLQVVAGVVLLHGGHQVHHLTVRQYLRSQKRPSLTNWSRAEGIPFQLTSNCQTISNRYFFSLNKPPPIKR